MPVGRQGGRKGKRSARRRVGRAGEEGCKKGGMERGEGGIREKEHGRKGPLPVASLSHLACTLRVSCVYHLAAKAAVH